MATACSVRPVSSSPVHHIGAASAQPGVATCEARCLGSSSRIVRRSTGVVSSRLSHGPSWSLIPEAVERTRRHTVGVVRAEALEESGSGSGSLQQSDQFGEGVSLATALLPPDVDLARLESLLFQWGNGLTANANLPLPTSLKVDKVKGGVRLGYIRINNGAIEDLVHIDVLVNAAEGDQQAYFQASRNGLHKDKVPPGEPIIMQSLLQALRKSIKIARE